MDNFGKYSAYYNLFYQNKDYVIETLYINRLIQKYKSDARTVLDLGCGTGRHCHLLAGHGFQVSGIDRSREMLELAMQNGENKNPFFFQGDIRNFRINRTYDVIISLFHVMSYQISNDDVQAVFTSVREHLNDDGIFIFDCWYGPAVLSDPPAIRIKRVENDKNKIIRIAEPEFHVNRNMVNVNYNVNVIDKATSAIEEINETHAMRYFFLPEIDIFVRTAGMRVLESFEYLSGKSLGRLTWNACFMVKKRND